MGIGIIMSMIAGFVLAMLAAFGMVNMVAGGTPAPVDKPYVVYGQS